MKSVINNPYRIAGILANSSEKDILKQKNKIKKFSAVGKEISSEYDFPFFPSLQRNSNTIDKAFSDIEQNQNRVFHSLFWFLNINPIDNTAIQYLISGNKEKAMEIWEKLTNEKEVNSKNFSAFNNISTLYLLGNSKEDLKRGVFSKINLIESESFKEFIHSVADETFSIDATKQIEVFVEELLKQFKGKYSTSETLELFSICNGATQKYLSKRFTEEPIHQIEMQIEQCNKKRAKNKSNAYKLGIDLYNNTRSDLTLLKSIVGRANLQYRMLADNVAREILQCSVDYFNASQEEEKDGNYFEDAMKLAKLAETIAVNDTTKNKVKENISTLEGMKDREVSLIVEVLKSVKLMYEDNEREIIQEIKKIEENDVFIKLGHKSINWDGVNKNIKNSINWENVNNLLVEILSDENLKKIKESDNIEIKKEFIELANWIKEKSLKSSVISGIIERYKKIIPKLPFRIISSEVTNTDNKPLYTKFIRYIGLNLEVEVYENKTIELYVKYIRPNGSIDHNSQVSPNKYTSSQVEKLTRFKKTINVLGWGNSKKCTYEVGKHRIEVYLDEYMIHSKEFVVDLAPSEKIEKKLIVAESKLKDIKQTTYFALDINVEKNELEEIKKFKLFRGSSEKQRQIETQQLKINELIKHSEAKKAKEIKLQNMRIIELKAKLLETKY